MLFDLPTPGLGCSTAETHLLHLAHRGAIAVLNPELLPADIESISGQRRPPAD
jgi:hypothetical protein